MTKRPQITVTRRAILAGAVALSLPVRAGPLPGPALIAATAATGLAFGGTRPGPVLRLPRGVATPVRVENRTDRPLGIAWHGFRGPGSSASVPGLTGAAIAPGESCDQAVTARDAGTFFYRASGADADWQRDAGLIGGVIVDDPASARGDIDLLLVLDEVPGIDSAPPKLTVTGTAGPTIRPARGARVRMRVANGTRTLPVAVTVAGAPATVIAIDGRPAEPFLLGNGLMAPGNRLDLIVDIADRPLSVEANSPRGALTLLAINPDPSLPPLRAAPEPLVPLPAGDLPGRMDFRSAIRRDVVAGPAPETTPAWPFAGNRPAPLFSARRGQTVQLALINRAPVPRVFHLHGQAVRLLDSLDDGWKPFWLDTVPVAAGGTARIAFRVEDAGAFAIAGQALASAPSDAPLWYEVI
jgi:FtsP/CotA-like multicopper oxidase with cupredoxin domain